METKITTFSAIADNINSCLHEGLRQLIFSSDEAEADDLRVIGTMERIVEIAYMLIYLDWSKRKNGLDKNMLSPHARNAVDLLEKVYVSEKLCLDVVIYVLTEVKRDVIQMGDASFFAGSLTNHDCRYGHIFDLIYYWTYDIDFCEKNLTVIFNAVLSVLESVNWFKDVELSTVDGEMVFTVGDKSYPCGDYFCKVGGRYCLLESYDLIADYTARCKYVCFGDVRNTLEVVKTKEDKK